MIRLAITYENMREETVTKDFYFNITKLEAMEFELMFDGGIEGHMNKLAASSDAENAFKLFKDIVLASYGIPMADGDGFDKTPEIRHSLEISPALPEIIVPMVEDYRKGLDFIEGCLPKRVREQAKIAIAEQKKSADKMISEMSSQDSTEVDKPADEPRVIKDVNPVNVSLDAEPGPGGGYVESVLIPQTTEPQLESGNGKPRTFESYTRQELLEMSDEDFDDLAGNDPKKMDKNVLLIAMQRVNQRP